eukprot:Nk52_evm1s620 gene=Nk52_evmTU1s620
MKITCTSFIFLFVVWFLLGYSQAVEAMEIDPPRNCKDVNGNDREWWIALSYVGPVGQTEAYKKKTQLAKGVTSDGMMAAPLNVGPNAPITVLRLLENYDTQAISFTYYSDQPAQIYPGKVIKPNKRSRERRTKGPSQTRKRAKKGHKGSKLTKLTEKLTLPNSKNCPNPNPTVAHAKGLLTNDKWILTSQPRMLVPGMGRNENCLPMSYKQMVLGPTDCSDIYTLPTVKTQHFICLSVTSGQKANIERGLAYINAPEFKFESKLGHSGPGLRKSCEKVKHDNRPTTQPGLITVGGPGRQLHTSFLQSIHFTIVARHGVPIGTPPEYRKSCFIQFNSDHKTSYNAASGVNNLQIQPEIFAGLIGGRTHAKIGLVFKRNIDFGGLRLSLNGIQGRTAMDKIIYIVVRAFDSIYLMDTNMKNRPTTMTLLDGREGQGQQIVSNFKTILLDTIRVTGGEHQTKTYNFLEGCVNYFH